MIRVCLTLEFPLPCVQTLSDVNKTTDDLEVKHVKLLIEDARAYPNPFKISQDVFLTVVDRDFCNADEWRADLHELLVKLQLTNAALTGLHPQLHIYFLLNRLVRFHETGYSRS